MNANELFRKLVLLFTFSGQLGISVAGLSALKHRYLPKKPFDSLSNEDNLEISGSLIQNRLSDLRKASEDQDKRINASLTELQEERRKADDLLQDFQPYDVFASPNFVNENIEHLPNPNSSEDDNTFKVKKHFLLSESPNDKHIILS